jgi:NAD(P)H-flavin reductase
MSSNGNPYQPIRSEVLEVTSETPTIRTLRLKPDKTLTFEPGQFIELTIPGVGEAPFTPSSRATQRDEMQVTVMRVGRVTECIHRLSPGDVVGLRGPLGKGYPMANFRGKEVLVVGGGCGFAPLRSLMYAFFEMSGQLQKLIFRGGCRSSKELLFRSEMKEWAKRADLDMVLTVDKGDDQWDGPVGVVTTILEGLAMDCHAGVAVVCGPPVMMKFATLKLLSLGFQEDSIYLSMEKNMSCGIGKCGHCRLGTFYCCREGPVFMFAQIKDLSGIWE